MQYQPVVGKKLAGFAEVSGPEENALVNDLYAVVAPVKDEMICEDHVHLTPAGLETVAEQTANALRAALGR